MLILLIHISHGIWNTLYSWEFSLTILQMTVMYGLICKEDPKVFIFALLHVLIFSRYNNTCEQQISITVDIFISFTISLGQIWWKDVYIYTLFPILWRYYNTYEQQISKIVEIFFFMILIAKISVLLLSLISICLYCCVAYNKCFM